MTTQTHSTDDPAETVTVAARIPVALSDDLDLARAILRKTTGRRITKADILSDAIHGWLERHFPYGVEFHAKKK